MSFGLRSATVRFGPVTALRRVDLSVEPCGVEVVIGADGAGKTTLARVLAGLVDVDEGQVQRPHHGRIGYQPESAGTWRDLTVIENLRFVAAAHGALDDSRARIDELLHVTRLGRASKVVAGALSGGMRQKLAVAMAMLARPDLVVLDEPTTGLDPVGRADVWRLLTRAAGEGSAIVATTAYLDEAERAHHVVVLDEGSVLLSGTAHEIRASFPGRMVATEGRHPHHPSWRRGRQWRTWIERDGAGDDRDAHPQRRAEHGGLEQDGAEQGRALEPDLDDVVMAASIRRREASA